jgi:NAD(P)-dependent dehydrogenase (short-subunit alcohol dehydrogenase family)
MTRFMGRTAVVTGGSSGIGAAISQRLTNEGARVMIWDKISPPDLQKNKSLTHVEVDISNWESITKAIEKTKLKKLDVLVCSAGISGPNEKTWEYKVSDWFKVFDINLHGTFFCNKACAPLMIKNGYGRIINIASIAGKEGNPNASAYSASKAAVIGLTKSLGKELASYPITVNCVTPAAVKTDIFNQMTQDHINYMLSKIPMGRFGTPEEISSLVCWLASSECSFTTGGVFDVSGGRATY